jgi:hypothetical protein
MLAHHLEDSGAYGVKLIGKLSLYGLEIFALSKLLTLLFHLLSLKVTKIILPSQIGSI